MRILLIDDEQLVLEGLEALLHARLEDTTVDAASELGSALALLSRFDYQLVVLDWRLLGPMGERTDGHSILQALNDSGRRTPVLVVSGDDQLNWPDLVLQHGLAGFVPKTASGQVLLQAIEATSSGGLFFPQAAAQSRQRPQPVARPPTAPQPGDPKALYPELTDRQVEVFLRMAQGLGDKHIARELGIAETTVKAHVRAILQVVGVGRRGQAVYRLHATPGESGG